MKRTLLLISFLILSPPTFAQTPTQQTSLKDLGGFLKPSPSKEKIKPSKNLKEKVIKNKRKPKTIIIKKTDEKNKTRSNPYRKISSKKFQKKLNGYIELMADSCHSKHKTRSKRLNLFKSNMINLRTYLETIIESGTVTLEDQMESKIMYAQIKEDNFPALTIMEEDISIKEKVSTLKASFKSFYMNYYRRDENNPHYESWAKTLLTGINCIENQSR